MSRFLILFIFISASLEIEKCDKEIEICSCCTSGYTLVETNSGKECIETNSLNEVSSKIENCIEISESDNNKCKKCKREYIPSYNNKRCEYRPHCSEVDINNKCTKCEKPYTLNDGECITNPPCEKMENEKCSSCLLYYKLKSKICQRDPSYEGEHCKNKNQNDLSICLKCEKDYYLTTTGECIKTTNHCVKEYRTGYCEKCEEGYYLYESQSKSDEKDWDWYYYKTCKKYPSHCLNFGGGECLECETGYYIYRHDECKEGLNHCVYGRSSKCSECETGYYYDDNECLKTPDKNCLSYKNVGGTWKCVKCFDKYYVDNITCKEFPDKNCKSYNIEGGNFICKNCEEGYYLNNNKCLNKCKTTEKICDKCQRFYGSFDYGQTCTLLDSDKIDIYDDNNSKFMNINLILIFWLLILIS